LGETNHLIVGNFVVPNDVDYLSFIFVNTEKIRNLKRYEFLYRDEEGNEKIIKAKP
jgi:hypothetical protein